MLNVELRPSAAGPVLPFNILNSAFNIQHLGSEVLNRWRLGANGSGKLEPYGSGSAVAIAAAAAVFGRPPFRRLAWRMASMCGISDLSLRATPGAIA